MRYKMKKLILILEFVLTLGANAWADICYDVTGKEANKAVEIIQTQKAIYQYCSLCSDAEPKTIPVNNITKGSPVYVNGVALDLAHTYYKQNNKFVNLGIASGCIKAGEYNIAAELDDLPDIHRNKESDREQAKKLSQEKYKQCVDEAQIKENITTSDMTEQNTKINDCLANVIKSEIENGFNSEQQKEMLDTLNQIRKFVWKFYYGIYAENKYCYGACGTVSNVLPYIDENKILMEMLEQVIYLNITKNGY